MALGDDRQVILEKYGPYVRSLAATVRKQFNAQLELDELLAYGQIGLLEAAERFDPKVGANFLTFAHYRIKGAIFDGLRKMGVLRGSDARSAYVGERAAAYLGNLSDREAGAGNRGSSFDDDVNDISDAVTGLAMVFATSIEGADTAGYTDESLPVDIRMEQEQLKTRVRAAIEKLPEKERKLLMGYYFQGRTLEEAGAEIGQSKSWASRLHARAIDRLKELLNEEEELPPSPTDARRVSHGGSDGRSLRGAGRPAEAAGSGRSADEQAGRVEVRRSSR
ncbi:sigma-70 family RNA polymerase sigma factor [Myxococcus sp. AM009]|uniref:sigma-70 family RNA polymerase sigma factor n=1 Tax=unclassified Myxococcus TaxID=2648731 RepID=UPI0015958D98|nr:MULTISPECIES: sigma-70 family RNA polymerase sigma factor [unclassified Myxococcus]NVI98963.1 sigma-70 family RNA polymerase sigma factor [Myxococcus sp. AM009]NVJ16130.1 sigma-70 family RNA polymerase sigma factor [Myxococcus sp. AM010]